MGDALVITGCAVLNCGVFLQFGIGVGTIFTGITLVVLGIVYQYNSSKEADTNVHK